MSRGTSDLDAMRKDDRARTEGMGCCAQVRSNNADIVRNSSDQSPEFRKPNQDIFRCCWVYNGVRGWPIFFTP